MCSHTCWSCSVCLKENICCRINIKTSYIFCVLTMLPHHRVCVCFFKFKSKWILTFLRELFIHLKEEELISCFILTCINILSFNVYIIISVRSWLFMVDTDCMKHLVLDCWMPFTTITNWYSLLASLNTNIWVTSDEYKRSSWESSAFLDWRIGFRFLRVKRQRGNSCRGRALSLLVTED